MQATAAQTQVTAKQLAEEMLAFWHSLMKQSDTTAGLYTILDELDLALTQVKTLHVLAGCVDEVSLKGLGERLNMSLPGASRTVDGLLQRGYLERREDDQDRRMKRVRI